MIWRKLHVSITDDDYLKLKEVLPERGALQHLMRRFIRALIKNPNSNEILVPLRMSLLSEAAKGEAKYDSLS